MCSRGSVRVTHTARPVPPHRLQEDDLSEFPACTAAKYSSTESARFPSAVHTWSGSGTVLPDLPHLMTFGKQDSVWEAGLRSSDEGPHLCGGWSHASVAHFLSEW